MMALIVSIHLGLFFSVLTHGILAMPKVPAIYVFGDSLFDVGNGNYMPGSDQGKANHLPYGIDFPTSKPTGRYSNGYNAADFIAKHMGFQISPPPYLSIKNRSNHEIFMRGVSFACGGSGLLDTTTNNNATITMTEQIKYFMELRLDIVNQIGIEETNKLFAQSIFASSSGGNDVFALYTSNDPILPLPNSVEDEFLANMESKYIDHIKALYNLGARKFAILNVPMIGCVPEVLIFGNCINRMNKLVQRINDSIESLFKNLSSQLQGFKYSIGNSYAVIENIRAHPAELGFKLVNKSCCRGQCLQNSTYCEDRDGYLFWDAVHPSQKAAKEAALAFYSGSLKFASPINFKQLVQTVC